MKKIISSKSALLLSLFSSIGFFGFSATVLILIIRGTVREIGAALLMFGFFLCFSCFLLWYLNRAACIVWVENGIVKRRGFLCGFHKECPIRSIRRVKVRYNSKYQGGRGTFIYLVDDTSQEYRKFLRIRKDSYICFRKTKKNLLFLQTFWSGTIEV